MTTIDDGDRNDKMCLNALYTGIIITVIAVCIPEVSLQMCSGSRCGECLVTRGCAWCKDRDYGFDRCANMNKIIDDGCIDIVKRKNHTLQIIQDDDFSDGGPRKDPIQIKPQRVKIKLVPNADGLELPIFYRTARNFPLDLYFLNDPSYTMRSLVSTLNNLVNDIAGEIATLTNDFRFGLGTSMDKVIMPFTRTDPRSVEFPCGDVAIYCDQPYSFIHRQPLTRNIQNFRAALSRVNTTANTDITEGLFDGLMQVMVCGDRIGWRRKSRRMVIFATDINFHQAGDGRFSGILEPNDCLCHLDSNGKYTKAEIQDYPSVGQILQKARENNINVLFVIGGEDNAYVRRVYYDNLAAFLPGGIDKASALNTDASNILRIVGDSFRRLRDTVKLVTSSLPEELVLTLYTDCNTNGRLNDSTNICTNLTLDKTANFIAYIQSNLTECPDKNTFTFTIFPEGLEERVNVDFEHVCDCDCQLEPEAEPRSPKCNGRGRYECGTCICDDGWFGETCDCDGRGTETEACGTESGICNGAGNCTCRKCDCLPGYSGEKCECNDQNCRSHNGLLCGGPAHGRCVCGECVCNANYTGDACDCTTITDTCRDKNGTLCSDNGDCECGRCRCNVGYRGPVCRRCQNCPGTCENNNDCVECIGFKQGRYNETTCNRKCRNVETVPLLEEASIDNGTSVTVCVLQDEFGCIINFNVHDLEMGQRILIKSTKRCPPSPPDPLTIGLSLSGAIFLIGLLLLVIWKILTMLYDSMEYSKFESEIQNPAWEQSENPIYKECVTTVQNPLHDTEGNGNSGF
ncbi:integrin beta-6-like [Ostrea edulis]|uniref:integrin beta-6-like n=1 Tax=Ostrea edulis TaxID=37623 RepID=UPI0024AFE499|nr:integrin beta-6-like [Ostrea edulis]